MIFMQDTPTNRLLNMKMLAGAKITEDTATGNPAVFETDVAKALSHLKVNFLPVQAGSGDPSPSNVRNISGWTGLKVEHFDENLLTINRSSAQTNQGITYTPIKQDNKTVAVKVEGTRSNTNPFFNLNYISKQGGGAGIAIPAGTYKIFGGTAEVRLQVFYHDENGVERIAGYDDGNGATVTIPADCTASWCRLLTWVDTPVDTVIYPIIMASDSSVTVYPVTWTSEGTVYGGYVDLVTGEVWATWAGIDNKWSDGTNESIIGTSITRKKFSVGSAIKTKVANSMCNIATYSTSEVEYIHFYVTTSGNVYLFLPSETDSDTAIQVASALETPTLITTLTPQQINALIGNNTVWSDANGDCEITYKKKG